MAEKLNDNDLKAIVKVITDLHKERGTKPEELELKTKVIRIITRQPDPIPYFNCGTGNWSHDFPTPYCKTCYGVPANYGK